MCCAEQFGGMFILTSLVRDEGETLQLMRDCRKVSLLQPIEDSFPVSCLRFFEIPLLSKDAGSSELLCSLSSSRYLPYAHSDVISSPKLA